MAVLAMVIFLVTKVSPLRGDSWLNKIPLQAKISISFPIVLGNPKAINLRGSIRKEGIKRRIFIVKPFCFLFSARPPYNSNVEV